MIPSVMNIMENISNDSNPDEQLTELTINLISAISSDPSSSDFIQPATVLIAILRSRVETIEKRIHSKYSSKYFELIFQIICYHWNFFVGSKLKSSITHEVELRSLIQVKVLLRQILIASLLSQDEGIVRTSLKYFDDLRTKCNLYHNVITILHRIFSFPQKSLLLRRSQE